MGRGRPAVHTGRRGSNGVAKGFRIVRTVPVGMHRYREVPVSAKRENLALEIDKKGINNQKKMKKFINYDNHLIIQRALRSARRHRLSAKDG